MGMWVTHKHFPWQRVTAPVCISYRIDFGEKQQLLTLVQCLYKMITMLYRTLDFLWRTGYQLKVTPYYYFLWWRPVCDKCSINNTTKLRVSPNTITINMDQTSHIVNVACTTLWLGSQTSALFNQKYLRSSLYRTPLSRRRWILKQNHTFAGSC